MTLKDNVLLVEDEPRWSEIYERAVRRVGFESVRAVTTFADAEQAVDAMRFAVAVVDIGLQVDDDRNVDGLRVMEKIRSVGDRTSIIVVTGRSGRDVLPIVRDAIKKYDAHDTVAKSTLVPAELRDLVASGLREYEQGSASDRDPLFAALRGDTDQAMWDDRVLRGTAIRGGSAKLYSLVEALFAPFLPLIPGQPRGVQMADGVAAGVFWSRGTGQPVAACFGTADRAGAAARSAQESGLLADRYPVGKILQEDPESKSGEDQPDKHPKAEHYGVVYELRDCVRADFE